MITTLPVQIYSQRDPRWQGQRLGTKDGATIGQYGCGITCISMANAGFDPEHPLTPNQVDDLFTNQSGYARQDLIIWTAVNRILPNMALVGNVDCGGVPAPVDDIKARLDSGQLAIMQVGFGGVAANMHFLLAVGYTTGINGAADIIFHDPWFGDRSQFSSRRYGSGIASQDILGIHYFADGVANQSVKIASPVSSPTSAAPAYQEIGQPGGKVTIIKVAPHTLNVHSLPTSHSPVVGSFKEGDIVPWVAYVCNGEVIENNPNWYKTPWNTYFSMNFSAPYTEPTPVETPAPEAPAPVAETPAPEWEQTWTVEAVAPKVVAVPEADVFSFPQNKVVKKLAGGSPVAELAGHFTVNGQKFYQTKHSADQHLFNGILDSNLRDYVAPTPGLGAIDGIQAPPAADLGGPVNYEEPPAPIAASLAPDYSGFLRALGESLLGVLSSPLRLVGIFNNIMKGKK